MVDFHYAGPVLDVSACKNCYHVKLDEAGLRRRIKDHLGSDVKLALHGTERPYQKLCDLKPMWPALFPDLLERHEWIGVGDYDVLYGDLNAELARLWPMDELLVPQGYYPTPLANGQLLFMRTTDKMVHAYRRAAGWKAALRDERVVAFDEWWARLV